MADASAVTAAAAAAAAAKERRFGPIYEALSEYNYRQAVKLCDKKENAAHPLAKALKARAMERSGLEDDARSIAMEVLRGKPTDIDVVAALSSVFQRSGDMGLLVQLCDTAVAERPDDKDLLRQSFFAFLKVEEYKKMQSMALRLAKLTADPQYFFWAAWAMHAVIGSGEEVASPAPNPITGGGRQWLMGPVTGTAATSLRLAETMMERALDAMPPGNRDSERVGLLLHTMARQGRAAEALLTILPGGKYRPRDGATASSSGSVGSSTGVATTAATSGSIPRFERAADEEVAVRSDGKEGRGRSPGPMQEVDLLRYTAFLRTEVAHREEGQLGSGDEGASKEGVASVRAAWLAAQESYADLLLHIDSDDWAYHSGLAYCMAKGLLLQYPGSAAGGVAALEAAAEGVLAACEEGAGGGGRTAAPATATLCGLPAVDRQLYSHALPSAAAASGSVEGSSPVDDASSVVLRSKLLAALQLLCVHLEIGHRVRALHSDAAAAAAKLDGALARGRARYVVLIQRCVAALAHKGCVFSDLKLLLTPLLQGRPLPAAATAAPAPQPDTPGGPSPPLPGFLAPGARILAMPFAPLALVGSAADSAPAAPPMTWSFRVSPTEAAPLVADLHALASKNMPDAAFAGDLRALHVSACQAAATAARGGALSSAGGKKKKEGDDEGAGEAGSAPAATGGKGGKKDKRKGGKGGAAAHPTASGDSLDDGLLDGPSTGPSSTGAADPHGVQAVLHPLLEVALTPEQERAIVGAKARIRRYASARQLLRYVTPPPAPGDAAASLQATLASAAELARAWECTLPLLALNADAAVQREVEESDDLVLLAVHLLWQAAFAALATHGPQIDDPSPVGVAAARRLLVESVLLLQFASLQSPTNAQFHLAGARVYAWLGLNACLVSHWRALRVKHVLLDTLSHLALPHALRLSWPDTVRVICEEVSAYHKNAQRDVPECIRVALRDGNLSSAADMSRLRVRLRESATFLSARSAYAHLFLTHGASTLSEAHSRLRCLILTGEVPDAWVDVSQRMMARLRDQDDREAATVWDPPSDAEIRLRLRGGGLPSAAAAGASSLPPDAYSTTVSALACGGSGGMSERALRRVGRDGVLRLRHAVSCALLWALEPSLDRLREETAKVRAVLRTLGLLPPPTDEAEPEGLPAPPSRQPAHTFASTTAVWDLASGSLVGVDTGVSSARLAASRTCAWLLVAALDVAHAVLQASSASPTSEERGSLLVGVPALLSLLAAEACVLVDATCGSLFSDASTPHTVGAGAVADATLLAEHTLPFVAIALGSAARALVAMGASASVPAAGKAGKPAAKGATAPKGKIAEAVADAPAADALAPSRSSPLAAEACAAVKAAAAELAQASSKLERALSAAVDELELPAERERNDELVFGAFPLDECVTDVVRRHAAARWSPHPPAAPAPAAAPGGKGEGEVHVASVEQAQSAAFHRITKETWKSAALSMGSTLSKVRAEAQARTAFLKSIRC